MAPLGAWLVEQNAPPSQCYTKQLLLSALLKGTSAMTGYQTQTLLLKTPELGSDEIDRSAMTSYKQLMLCKLWSG